MAALLIRSRERSDMGVVASRANHAVFAANVATFLPFLAAFATHNAQCQVADPGKPA